MNVLHIDIRTIAIALGGDVIAPNEIHAPGPEKQTEDRPLFVSIVPWGLAVHSFVDDSFEACRNHVSGALGPGKNIDILPMPQGEISLRWWNEAQDISGTLAELYLRSRGLIPSKTSVFNEVRKQLKFHPSCPFGKQRVPCMLALERNIFNNEPSAVIRIALDSNGNSNERLFVRSGRSAVKLCDTNHRTRLAIERPKLARA